MDRANFTESHSNLYKTQSANDDIETRTVFIRGIPNDAVASEIQRQFELFGDIAIFDERIRLKGIAFVTYVRF